MCLMNYTRQPHMPSHLTPGAGDCGHPGTGVARTGSCPPGDHGLVTGAPARAGRSLQRCGLCQDGNSRSEAGEAQLLEFKLC